MTEKATNVGGYILFDLTYWQFSYCVGPLWEQYASDNERLIQFDGDGIEMIDDSFRKAQMDYINSIPLVFLHWMTKKLSGNPGQLVVRT